MTDTSTKGVPKGRRPVVWVLSEHPFEKIIINDQDPDKDGGLFPKENAIVQYEKKHGKKPKFILGPFYDKKGGTINKKQNKNKKSICRDISQIRLRAKQKSAIYNGWRGVANFLEGNDKQVYFIFLREVDPDNSNKKEAPNPGVINIEDIELCE